MSGYGLLSLLALLTVASSMSPPVLQSSSSSSQYVHSNDTIQVYLNPESQVSHQLYGAAGTEHELEFIVANLFKGGHFSFA